MRERIKREREKEKGDELRVADVSPLLSLTLSKGDGAEEGHESDAVGRKVHDWCDDVAGSIGILVAVAVMVTVLQCIPVAVVDPVDPSCTAQSVQVGPSEDPWSRRQDDPLLPSFLTFVDLLSLAAQ